MMPRSVLEIEKLDLEFRSDVGIVEFRIIHMEESWRSLTGRVKLPGSFGGWEFKSSNCPEIMRKLSGDYIFFLRGNFLDNDEDILGVTTEVFEEVGVAIGELNEYYQATNSQATNSLYDELFERMGTDV